MKEAMGGVAAAAAGTLGAYAIVNLVDLGSCTGACEDHQRLVPYLVGATLLLVSSAFLWRWAMVVGPVVGVAVAFGLLLADGAQPTGPGLGVGVLIAAAVLLGPAILVGLAIRGRRRRQVAARLVSSGTRGVAHIRAVRETGVFVNDRPQVQIDYRIHPLSGGQPFAHRKKQVLSYAAPPPRPGLAWPAWYDPADPSRVAIGAPSGTAVDPRAEAQYAEFGLTLSQVYGYDPTARQQDIDAQQADGLR